MRRELEPVLEIARTLAADELPALLGELETIRVVALARIMTPRVVPDDALLDIAEAAKRLHVGVDYLYRHHERLPFARRIGKRVLFSSVGLNAYLLKRDRRE